MEVNFYNLFISFTRSFFTIAISEEFIRAWFEGEQGVKGEGSTLPGISLNNEEDSEINDFFRMLSKCLEVAIMGSLRTHTAFRFEYRSDRIRNRTTTFQITTPRHWLLSRWCMYTYRTYAQQWAELGPRGTHVFRFPEMSRCLIRGEAEERPRWRSTRETLSFCGLEPGLGSGPTLAKLVLESNFIFGH